jgi:outer membrane protein assembly factor BamB
MAPVLFEGSVLFVSHEAVLYALNRKSGHLNWRAPLPARPLSAPLLDGTAVLVACLESDIVGFDGRTGAYLGRFRVPAEIHAAPIVIGDHLYVAQRDRSVAAYVLDQTPKRPPSPTPRPPARR